MTWREATTVHYRTPVSNNSSIYWWEVDASTGVAKLRRQNLTNNNVVSVSFGSAFYPEVMKVKADGVYTVGRLGSQIGTWSLQFSTL